MVKIQTITPQIAKSILEQNTDNRPKNPTRVQSYADDILNGRWTLNGETIKIAQDGRLIDGQHRLSACILANTSFQSYVVSDLEFDVFTTVDKGRPRSNSDVFNISDIKNHAGVSSILGIYTDIKNGCFLGGRKPNNANVLLELYSKNPDYFQDLHNKHTRGNAKLFKGVSASITAAFELYLSKYGDSSKFFELIFEPAGLSTKHPCYVISRTIQQMKALNKVLSRRHVMYLFIKGWNLYLSNSSVSQIRFNIEMDMPTPHRQNSKAVK